MATTNQYQLENEPIVGARASIHTDQRQAYSDAGSNGENVLYVDGTRDAEPDNRKDFVEWLKE